MTVPFNKIPVGNRMFVVEWDLEVNNNEVSGEAFEAKDAELQSVTALTITTAGDPALAKLYATNQSDAPVNPGAGSSYAIALNDVDAGQILPWPNLIPPRVLPQRTRFYFPRLEGPITDAATSKVCLLFKELN